MRRVTLATLAIAGIALATATAHADPVAFVVNADSASISVVDVNAGTALGTFSTRGNPRATGQEPSDVIFDAKSGRLFVSASGRLMSYNGRVPDGRGLIEVAAQGQPSALALDDAGRRIFMAHEDLGLGLPDGFITEFSIADPLNPVAVAQHTVRGLPDLRFIAWDPKFKRVYVMEEDGRVARTDAGPTNWVFMLVGGAGVTAPGGILADPNAGGVWLSGRGTMGRIMRITEPGLISTATTLSRGGQPRAMSWDPGTANSLLLAVQDINEVRSFNTVTNLTSLALATGVAPVDAAKIGTKVVSANRVASNVNGSVSITGGATASTEIKPVAIAVADLPPLFPEPSTATYCYNFAGDSSVKTFTVQNTRLSRLSAVIADPTMAGLNPTNYAVTGCHNVTLAWGASCTFTVRFSAQPPSIEPPPAFPPPIVGGFRPATWPAEIVVASTNAPIVSVRIPVRAALQVAACPGSSPIGPITPIHPITPVFPH